MPPEFAEYMRQYQEQCAKAEREAGFVKGGETAVGWTGDGAGQGGGKEEEEDEFEDDEEGGGESCGR